MPNQRLMLYEGIREKAYHLLAWCYLMPDTDIFEKLGELRDALDSVCPDACEFVVAMSEKIAIDKLVLDYTKLFIGPYKVLAPPYGSIYLDNTGTVMGPSTVDVRKRYQEYGLDLSETFKDAPDHISAEFEFMYFLIFQEIEALKKSDYESSLGFLEAQQSFLMEHMGKWVADFSVKIEEHAETSFYRQLAKVTKIFINTELKNISPVSIAKLNKSMETV